VELSLVAVKDVIVFLIKKLHNLLSGSNVLELSQEVKGAFRRTKVLLEGLLNQIDDGMIDLADLADEGIILGLPG